MRSHALCVICWSMYHTCSSQHLQPSILLLSQSLCVDYPFPWLHPKSIYFILLFQHPLRSWLLVLQRVAPFINRGWRKRQVLLQPRDDWQGEMWELTRMLAEFLSDSTYQTGSSQFAAGHVCFLQLINVQRIQTYSTITTIHELP